jgi:hypothetical protein
MLELGRQTKIIKNEEKNEEIVNTQGFLKQIPRQELGREFFALYEIDPHIKKQGHPDPDSAPDKRFLHFDLVSLSVKHPEVQGKQDNDYHPKNRPI